jgi:hypothetical protein
MLEMMMMRIRNVAICTGTRPGNEACNALIMAIWQIQWHAMHAA